jgi:hypothetical protein
MDYKKIYEAFMSSRLDMKDERKIQKKNGEYFERHHIVPISLGGDKSYFLGSSNIVLLTAREHYLAHRILWLIYKNREMGFAFHKMVFSKSTLQERGFDSKAYEAAKIALSECQRGENNPMYGRVSPMKGKVSSNKGKKLDPRPDMQGESNPSKRWEVRKKISSKLRGKDRPNGRGPRNSNFGGKKLLLHKSEIVGSFDRLEEMLPYVPTSIYNLRNHLRSRSGGLILGEWQVFYEKDYQQKSPE